MTKTDIVGFSIFSLVLAVFFGLMYYGARLDSLKECAKTTPYIECYKVIMGE